MSSHTAVPDALSPDEANDIRQVVELLRRSRSILFITGAGLSADSGLPTYRGIGGLYQSDGTEDGLPIEVLLSGDVLRIRPDLTWKYLLQIEQACRAAAPNRGHEVIAQMDAAFDRVWVLTQNVDGFHRRAGSRNVIDIHGDLYRVRCMQCRYAAEVADYEGFTPPPRCPRCPGLLRPDVVLFGEALPSRQAGAYEAEVLRGFDLVFSVGTTSLFPYIAAPVLHAHRRGTPSVEINPGRTEVSDYATVRLPLAAARALDAIWREYSEHVSQPSRTSDTLVLRRPRTDEEQEFLHARRAASAEAPHFLHHYQDGMPFARYVELLADHERGANLDPGHVPETFLFAFKGPTIVGRISIRHRLNDALERLGGHIGYVVVPEFRRQGHATEILRLGLQVAHERLGLERVLLTCDDDNVGSIRTIERNGGVLADVVTGPDLRTPQRRYWIDCRGARRGDRPMRA